MRTHRKTLLEIHYTYLGNKEIFHIFNTCCIIMSIFYRILCVCVCPPPPLSFSVLIMLTFFTNHALKFKYHPRSIKGLRSFIIKCRLCTSHALPSEWSVLYTALIMADIEMRTVITTVISCYCCCSQCC